MQKIGRMKYVFEAGQMQVVEDDVLNIVRRVSELSPRLTVYWNEHIEQFTITETSLDGAEERLVMNVAQLDERVLDRLQVADQWRGNDVPSHVLPESEDFLSIFEAAEKKVDEEKDERIRDRVGEVIEPLASYMDLDGRGTKASILLPRGVDDR
jgi:hypothetical protein